MQPMGDIHAHYWLTLGMARAVGVNLTKALQEGQITRDQYADIVTRCRSCQWCEGCTNWLAQQTDIAETVPKTCANYETFKVLKTGAPLPTPERV